MSRFLEFQVPGSLDAVPERAKRAFQSVGRLQQYDATEGIRGTIRAGSQTSDVTVLWKPGRSNGKVHIEVRASTDQPSNKDGDAALYTFVRAYRNTPWPDPVADARARSRNRWRWVLAMTILAGAAAAAYWLTRH